MDSDAPAQRDQPLTAKQLRAIDQVLASKPMPIVPRPLPATWWFKAAAIGWALMLFGCIVAWVLLGSSAFQATAAWNLIPLSLSIAGALIAVFSRLRPVKVLKESKCFLCPTCHYPLDGCPDEGTCPECGTMYRRNEVVRMWKSAYGLKDRFPLSAEEAAREG